MCIDIVEVWFWIANGQISSIFRELPARDTTVTGYNSLTFLFGLVRPKARALGAG